MKRKLKGENIKRKKHPLVYVIYFLIGLLFNYLGLITASLWIKLKEKTQRRQKFIALLLGFGVYSIVTFIIIPLFIQPYVENILYKQFPEIREVIIPLQQKYQNENISAQVTLKTFYNSEEKTTIREFNIQYLSDEIMTPQQMKNMALQTCEVLAAQKKNYDVVGIKSYKYLFPFHLVKVHKGIKESCDEWKKEDFKDTNFPL